MELQMPNMLAAFNGGVDRGKGQRYATLASQAMVPGANRQQIVSEMAGIDPKAAQQFGGSLEDQDERALRKAAGAARYIVDAAKSGNVAAAQAAYRYALPALQPWAERAGKTPPPDFSEDMVPGLEAIAGVFGSGSATGRVQSTYVDEHGQRVAIMADGSTKVLGQNEAGMRSVKVTLPDGREATMTFDPRTGTYMQGEVGAPAMPPPQASAGPTGGASQVLASSFDDAVAEVLNTEGGYVGNDAGAGPTNYGINSRANPDLNVASLSPEQAKQVYRERYWNAIDADNLPANIRLAVFDAAVNQGPQKALELYRASGGDPQRFAALRQQHYDSLVAENPQKYGQYADGWRARNARTAGIPLAGLTPGEKAAQEAEAKARVEARYAPQTAAATERAKIDAQLSRADQTAEAEAARQREIERAKVEGQAAGEKRANAGAEWRNLQAANSEIDQTINLVKSILRRKAQFGGVTGAGAIGAKIPGSRWADLATDIERLRTRSGFQTLQDMRNNSPTGGALGNITERELAGLQNASANLQNAQSPESLERSLTQYLIQLYGTKERTNRAYTQRYGSGAPSGGAREVRTQAEYDALPSGSLYLEDGKTYRKP